MTRTLLASTLLLASFVTAAEPAQPATVVDIAAASTDHSTLVSALKAADYVRSLQNAGPFTVFAPTNAAFAKLPKGTLENLMRIPRKLITDSAVKLIGHSTRSRSPAPA